MDIRAKLVYLDQSRTVTLSNLWDTGNKIMDMAYNAATARPLDFKSFWLDMPGMVFFFVGGRSSLRSFFRDPENQRVFVPANGNKIGIITDRKKSRLKKDKTAVGVCNVDLRCQFPVTPLTEFVGKRKVQPLDANGAYVTSAQLASILSHLFFDEETEDRKLRGVLKGIAPGW